MTSTSACFTLAAVLGCACAPAARPAATPGASAREAPGATAGAAAGAAAEPSRSVPLRYDVPLPGDLPPMRSPCVQATVGGKPVLLIVDTGAAVHTLASWAAEAGRVEVRDAAERASDQSGRSTGVALAPHPAIAIDGWGQVADAPAIVVDLPPFFEAAGIGGIVSPQLLAPPGQAVVLDLVAGTMSLADAGQAFDDLGAGASLTERGVRACGNAASTFPNVSFAAPVLVAGESVLLSIDTGADVTRVRASSPAGRLLAARATGTGRELGVAGASDTSLVPAVAISIGEAEVTTEVTLLPGGTSPICPTEGSLGLDVLRRCRLALNTTRLAGRCEP